METFCVRRIIIALASFPSFLLFFFIFSFLRQWGYCGFVWFFYSAIIISSKDLFFFYFFLFNLDSDYSNPIACTMHIILPTCLGNWLINLLPLFRDEIYDIRLDIHAQYSTTSIVSNKYIYIFFLFSCFARNILHFYSLKM